MCDASADNSAEMTPPAPTAAPAKFAAPPRTQPRAGALLAALASGALAWLVPPAALPWGDEGHEIIAHIAEHYLKPGVRDEVAAILATDRSGLTRDTGIAAEATWADKYRDSDRRTSQLRYRQTRAWHYIDIELDRPMAVVACDPRVALAPDTAASLGPAEDCIVDKIEQFQRELGNPAIAPEERRLALQFLLHLMGDIHQPLHAADDHDHGGNEVLVSAGRFSGNLHQYWDTVVVERMGADPGEVADRLIREISPRQRRHWSDGSPGDWARESFEAARVHAYGKLPRAESREPSDRSGIPVELDEAYESDAERTAALQLKRAGLRLAQVLNDALSTPPINRRSGPP